MYGYTVHMAPVNFRTIKHRGLKRFVESDDSRELRPDLVNRTRNILAALVTATNWTGRQARRAGGYTSCPGTGPGRGAFPFPATGASLSSSMAAKS
jgi:hypothetical protein